MKPQFLLTTAVVGSVILEGITAFAALGLVTATLTGGRFQGPGILTTVAVALASYGISRAMQHLDLNEVYVRRWAVGISAVLLYILMRAEFAGDLALWNFSWLGDLLGGMGTAIARRPDIFIGVFALLIMWVRGIVIGQSTLHFESFLFPFSVALVVTALAAAFAEDVGARESLQQIPILSAGLGLTVLALAHMSRVEAGPSQGFGRSWGPILLGTLALLIGLTIAFALLDFGLVRAILAPVVAGIIWVLNGIFLILTLVIIYPIYWLLRMIILALGFFISSERLQQLAQMLDERDANQRELQTPQLPGAFLILERLVVLSVVALVVGVALYWLFRRYSQSRRKTDGERESVFDRGSIGEDMNAMLNALLGRFRRDRSTRKDIGGELAPIRRLYLEVLDKAEDDGLSRRAAATPREFATPLVSHFRNDAPAEISEAFAAARYGRQYPSRAAVRTLSAAWRSIRGKNQ
jgi:hypothetical protein